MAASKKVRKVTQAHISRAHIKMGAKPVKMNAQTKKGGKSGGLAGMLLGLAKKAKPAVAPAPKQMKAAAAKPTKAAPVAAKPAAPAKKSAIAPAKNASAKASAPSKNGALAKGAASKTAAAPISAKGGKAVKGAAATATVPAAAAKGTKGKGVQTPSVGVSKAAAAAIAKVSAKLAGRAPLEPSSDAVCREVACEGLATSAGYCRMHYIKNWKKIKRKDLILKEGKLNQYIEELVAKYPDKYIEAIRHDLANDKEFAKVIRDLDLDEGIDEFDVDGDQTDLIDNIKREFEDEGESF